MQGGLQGLAPTLYANAQLRIWIGIRLMNPFRRLIRRWSRPDHRGQSLVEFALTLPLLLLIVMGTVDLGRAYFRVENLTNAVKEGAFFGARAPTCDTNLNRLSDLIGEIRRQLKPLGRQAEVAQIGRAHV